MLITHYGCLSSILGRQCDLVEEHVVFRYLLYRDKMAFSVIFLYVNGFPAVRFPFVHVLINSIMRSCVPYSCLLLRICTAKAD